MVSLGCCEADADQTDSSPASGRTVRHREVHLQHTGLLRPWQVETCGEFLYWAQVHV